jgi:two-component system cell cycle sensor histidine kinase/response regulator CckA
LLEDHGCSVRIFNQQSKLLAAFEASKEDVELVITDQTMSGLSGVALALHLHAARADLPIMMCTGYSDGLARSDLLRHGISRHFMKPVPADELLAAVAEVLRKSDVYYKKINMINLESKNDKFDLND